MELANREFHAWIISAVNKREREKEKWHLYIAKRLQSYVDTCKYVQVKGIQPYFRLSIVLRLRKRFCNGRAEFVCTRSQVAGLLVVVLLAAKYFDLKLQNDQR